MLTISTTIKMDLCARASMLHCLAHIIPFIIFYFSVVFFLDWFCDFFFLVLYFSFSFVVLIYLCCAFKQQPIRTLYFFASFSAKFYYFVWTIRSSILCNYYKYSPVYIYVRTMNQYWVCRRSNTIQMREIWEKGERRSKGESANINKNTKELCVVLIHCVDFVIQIDLSLFFYYGSLVVVLCFFLLVFFKPYSTRFVCVSLCMMLEHLCVYTLDLAEWYW